MNNAIIFKDVVKRYGQIQALDHLNISIPRGSIFGLVGSNGAGKTTFMSVVAGLVKPLEGHIDLLGQGSFDPSRHIGRISLLPQDSRLPYYARVDHLLHYYARLQGMSRDQAHEAVDEALVWVRLADRRESRIRSLSHGMLRRFTVAQAFLGNPDLVMLDEPMGGLDPSEVVNLRNLIKSRRGRQTIVISSHLLYELQHLCDHVAVIENGKTVRQDSMDNLTRSRHQVGYRLAHQKPPLAMLEEKVPDVSFAWLADQSLLVATYPDGAYDPADLNRLVLPILLEAEVPIVEINRGSDLESEYFEIHGTT